MLKRFLLAYRTKRKVFGVYVQPFALYLFLLFRRAFVKTGLALDIVFYPSLSQRKAQCVVILGNPRSGTTFMHRFLVELNVGCGMKIAQMLFPSITMQKLVSPLLFLLNRTLPVSHFSNVAHSTGLDKVDSDDAAIFANYFDGFFASPLLYGWNKNYPNEYFYPNALQRSKRDFRHLEKIWIRNSQATGQDLNIVKMFSLNSRVLLFLDKFPESRIVYMYRDPVVAIPSSLSLNTIVLDKAFGFSRIPESKKAPYIERSYKSYLELYRQFIDSYDAIPKKNIMVFFYEDLFTDFEGAMKRLFEFIGKDITPAQKKIMVQRMREQQDYKSEHKYSLEQFGLTEEQVSKDCAFIHQWAKKNRSQANTFAYAPEF